MIFNWIVKLCRIVFRIYSSHRAYPVYVNEYASGTQQQYYTTNESYSTTGNHQGETYIVPVEEALLASQSRESPQAISAVSSSTVINLHYRVYKTNSHLIRLT